MYVGIVISNVFNLNKKIFYFSNVCMSHGDELCLYVMSVVLITGGLKLSIRIILGTGKKKENEKIIY